jgi:hypothetical protein
MTNAWPEFTGKRDARALHHGSVDRLDGGLMLR